MNGNRPYVLSIAGFDPSAGAGVLSDIKTFEGLQVYGLGIITANTNQVDDFFKSTNWIDEKIIFDQLELILNKYKINFIKIGLVKDFEFLLKLAKYILSKNKKTKIIWDPILQATAGKIFHHSTDEIILNEILNKINLVTPNLDEIKILFNDNLISDEKISEIANYNGTNILLKGGHSDSEIITDKLFSSNNILYFEGNKFPGFSKHGTGCVLSSAVTAFLAKGESLESACRNAKKYIEKFITSNNTNLGYHN